MSLRNPIDSDPEKVLHVVKHRELVTWQFYPETVIDCDQHRILVGGSMGPSLHNMKQRGKMIKTSYLANTTVLFCWTPLAAEINRFLVPITCWAWLVYSFAKSFDWKSQIPIFYLYVKYHRKHITLGQDNVSQSNESSMFALGLYNWIPKKKGLYNCFLGWIAWLEIYCLLDCTVDHNLLDTDMLGISVQYWMSWSYPVSPV
jgi:hypothetical protein